MENHGSTPSIAKQSAPSSHVENNHRYLLVVLWLISLTPFLHIIATIDLDGNLSAVAYALRHLSIPVILLEITIILVAMHAGFSSAKTIEACSKGLKWILGIWAVFATLSSALSDADIQTSLFLLLRIIIHIFAFTATLYMISSSHFSVNRWVQTIMVGAILYIFAISCFAVAVPRPDTFPWALRLPSATNVRQIGIVVGLLSFFPLAKILFGNDKLNLGFVAAWFALVCFVAWTGTRTSFLGYAVGIPLAFIFVRKLPKVKNLVAAGFVSFAAICTSILLPSPAPEFGILRMVEKASGKENFSSGRAELWQTTLGRISENPVIGHGIGYFRQDVSDSLSTSVNHPHNIFLQFLYDWGLVGGSAAIAMLIILAVAVFKRAPQSPIKGFLAAASLMAVFAMSMIEGPLYHPLPVLVLMAAIAPLLAHKDENHVKVVPS